MRALVTVFFLIAFARGMSQEKLISLEINDSIVSAAVDRPGDFYILTGDGQIRKYDKDGKLLILYRHETAPTLFDPRDGSRLFAYYRALQQYEFYNPSFETVASHQVNPVFAIEPWLICPSGDHKLWLLDKADNTLKRLNAPHTEIEIEVVIDSTLIGNAASFISLRDYQGFVFALDPARGIFVFNSIGNHIRTIEAKGIRYFNFLGGELYFLKGGKVIFFDLFTARTRELPLEKAGQTVLLTDERMMVVNGRTVDFFEFHP